MTVYIITYISPNGTIAFRTCKDRESAEHYARIYTNGNYYITEDVVYEI